MNRLFIRKFILTSNMPDNLKSRVFTLIVFTSGLMLIIASLLFAGVLVLFSLPFIGFALYRFRKYRKDIFRGVNQSKTIDVKEWKIIDNK